MEEGVPGLAREDFRKNQSEMCQLSANHTLECINLSWLSLR